MIVALVCIAAGARKKSDATQRQAAVEFASTVYDFGNIREDAGKVTHEFVYTSTGQAPLAVLWAKAQCGCTKPKYSTSPLSPGKRGKISVTFIPKGYSGEFVKTVTVRTNAPGDQQKSTLKINVFVIQSNPQ